MAIWIVTSPRYEYKEVILDDGSGPTYETCDYTEIEAPTRKAAISLAVKKWLKEPYDNYAKDSKADGLSPYRHITAESEAELKERTHREGPPKTLADFCDDGFEPDHEGVIAWRWDDGDGEYDWGWYCLCEKHWKNELDDSFEG